MYHKSKSIIKEEIKIALENLAHCIPDRGLGLAMWKTGDQYEDIKFLARHISANLFTALHNPDKLECNNDDKSCDGILVNKTNFISVVLCDLFPLFQLGYTVCKVAYLKKYFIFSIGNKSLDRRLRCSELFQLMTGMLHT